MHPMVIVAIPIVLVLVGMVLNSMGLAFDQPPTSAEQDPAKRAAADADAYRRFFDLQRKQAVARQKRISQYCWLLLIAIIGSFIWLYNYTAKKTSSTTQMAALQTMPLEDGKEVVLSVTLNFDASMSDTAVLSYTVDGVVISKPMTRLTWKLEDLTGDYHGGFVYDFSQTHAPCVAGRFEDLGPLTITQSGTTSLVMKVQGSSRTCTFTGDYRQRGHMGTTRGTFLCTQGGLTGTYTGLEIEKSAHGVTGRIVGQTVSCEFDGRFGGVLR